MKKIKYLFYTVVITLSSLLISFNRSVIASTDPPDNGGLTVKLDNPLQMETLEELLIAILKLIMVLMVPVMVFFIIYAGFKYVTARGNPTTIQEATKALTYAIIGAVIILGAVAISQMIENTVDQFRQASDEPSIYTETPKLT